jgi:hypothetical protein
VRTLDEVLMFAVDGKGRIQRLEMLSFGEPEEYIPRSKWYAQFDGQEPSRRPAAQGATSRASRCATLTGHGHGGRAPHARAARGGLPPKRRGEPRRLGR